MPDPTTSSEQSNRVPLWPLHRRDPACTAYSPVGIAGNQGRVAWSYIPERPDQLDGPVILSDGTIIITSRRKRIIALDRGGNERWMWREARRGGLMLHPTIGNDGNVYARTEYDLFCVSSSGETLWSAQLPSTFNSRITVWLDKVFLVSSRELLCSDGSGDLRRFAWLPCKFNCTRPVVNESGVIFLNTLYAHERADICAVSSASNAQARVIWNKHFGMFVDGYGVHDPLLVDAAGNLHVNLTRPEDEWLHESLVFDSSGNEVGRLAFPVHATDPSGRYYSACRSKSSAQCRSARGDILWEAEGSGQPPQSSSTILAVTKDGSVLVSVYFYVDNEHNVITADWWDLYAISPEGKLRWTVRDNSIAIQHLTIGADGTIYTISRPVGQGPILCALR
jgi:outer membrane protein assembly factor BamB